MMTEEDLNKIVRDIVNSLIGISDFCIRGQQPGSPRPTGSYASAQFLTSAKTGWDTATRKDVDPNIEETIKGQRLDVYSVNFFRGNALENARKVRIGLQRSLVIDFLSANDVGLITVTEVINLSEEVSGTWEERAGFDITLNYVSVDTSTISTIESIDIVGNYDGYENTLNITEN